MPVVGIVAGVMLTGWLMSALGSDFGFIVSMLVIGFVLLCCRVALWLITRGPSIEDVIREAEDRAYQSPPTKSETFLPR